MKSSDRIALSVPAREAVDRQDPEMGGWGGKDWQSLWGRHEAGLFMFFVVFLKLYEGEDS